MTDTPDDEFDYAEAFRQANANPEFIADLLADVLRNLMRATASHDPGAAVWRATENLQYAVDLIRRCQEPLSIHDLLSRVVADVSEITARDDELTEAYVSAARTGMRYLIELSATDGTAQARASTRRREFQQEVEEIEQIRAERRRRHAAPPRRMR